jgi:hypothetical protein
MSVIAFTPVQRLAVIIIGLAIVVKVIAVATSSVRLGLKGHIGYFLWPGVDPTPFGSRSSSFSDVDGVRWGRQGLLVAFTGIAGAIALTLTSPHLNDLVIGWLGVAVLLTIFHLGLSDVLSGGTRMFGFGVQRLFVNPLSSVSLREFWGRRWNMAFVEMNRVLVMPLLVPRIGRRAAVGCAFLISGVLHELAISVPVGRGFGGPMLYFIIHGLLVSAERPLRLTRWPRPLARLWTWAWLLVPLPLLFHTPFRDALVVPLFTWSNS